MSSVLSLLESTAGWLLYRLRARDAKLFMNSPPIQAQPGPNIAVYSPDYDQTPSSSAGANTTAPTPTPMQVRHTQVGGNIFPSLVWTVPDAMNGKVDSWLVVVEDPDAPLPTPVVHGIYYGLPPGKTRLDNQDIELLAGRQQQGASNNNNTNEPGFYYGRNRPKTVWAGPKPVMGHGPHRYFFQVVGVQGVRWEKEGGVKREAGALTKEELVEIIQGKVVGWGVWTGVFERRWERGK